MSFTKNILLLIVSPYEGWIYVKKYSVPVQVMLSRVFYPMLAVLAITAFAKLIYNNDVSLAYCIQDAIIDFTKFFLGYHICSYILTGYFPKIVSDAETADRVNIAIIYNIIILVLLSMVDNLLPTPWLFIKIFYLYIFMISSKSAGFIGTEQNSFYLYLIAALAIFFPFVIEYLLDISLSLTTNV